MREKIFTTKQLAKQLGVSKRVLKYWALNCPMDIEKIPVKVACITAPMVFTDRTALFMSVIRELRLKGYTMQELDKRNKSYQVENLGKVTVSIKQALAMVIKQVPIVYLYDLNLIIVNGKSLMITTGIKGIFTETDHITGISFNQLRSKYLGGNV